MPPPRSTRAAASRILPFGLPQLHVGTDICHVSRVYAILKKARPASTKTTTSPPPSQTTAARFIRRVLTPGEVEALNSASAATSTASNASTTMSAHAAVALLARGSSLPTEDNASLEMTPLWRAAQFLAGRFAAKEAAIKAHPHLPGLTLQGVRIARRAASTTVKSTADGTDGDVVHRRNASSGPPLAYVRVYALETETDTDGDGSNIVEQEARISISHDGEYATAVCLGVEHT